MSFMRAALQDARRLQCQASDPDVSAFVSANAGSGKTYVLTQRVLRLLLEGTAPSKILCLTFTKTAAANMTERVFDRLAAWVRLDDDALRQDIEALGAPRPGIADLELARKLFARAIDTPGGLKIQTIHAFCERVLHLFPFEANVPAGFRMLDDPQARALWQQAQTQVFQHHNADFAQALQRVLSHVTASLFESLMSETVKNLDTLNRQGSPEVYATKLAQQLGLALDESVGKITAQILKRGASVWSHWAEVLGKGSPLDAGQAEQLMSVLAAKDEATALASYMCVFFKQDGGLREKIATKNSPVKSDLLAEQERLTPLRDKLWAARAVALSRDLFLLARTVDEAYARAKAHRGVLDYDDLIFKTQALLEKSDAAWVLYKLDRGLAHILVDEAQDTSPAQWNILTKLAEDFLSGESAAPERRSFFAVGDEKQSIFSFQGAAPHLFETMRRFFAVQHQKAARSFAHVRLTHSFRSAAPVLSAVDSVFSLSTVWEGVSVGEPSPLHVPIRDHLPGVVEIWPPVVMKAAPEPEDWRIPLDAQRQTHPANILADRIANVIAGWFKPGSSERICDPETGKLRPIHAGDVLILVRSRNALFHALPRALRRVHIDCAGADRLNLSQHIAVLDLCAVARVALCEADDLSLASVLKSPLFGLDETALLDLCAYRQGTLYDALRSSPFSKRVERWRSWAQLAPFDFFARVLGEDGGRRALMSRLGEEAGDAIDEFLRQALAYEKMAVPSLTGFLAEMDNADLEIKRDMEAASAQVRVMTVHAAKGLEAPIVFLPDTHEGVKASKLPKWLSLQDDLPVTSLEKQDCRSLAEARERTCRAAAGEHRRLLYVAMTRAAQRLIICGYEGAKPAPPESWRQLITPGLQAQAREVTSGWNPSETILRFGEPVFGESASLVSMPEIEEMDPPAWLMQGRIDEVQGLVPVVAARALRGERSEPRLQRIQEGQWVHRMLQMLPQLPPEKRREAAERFLSRHEILAKKRENMIENVMNVINLPALAPIFGPNSRAEVSFSAQLHRKNGQIVPIQGRIDRIGREGDDVVIADFKTGPAEMREEYMQQLALYYAATHKMFVNCRLRGLIVFVDECKYREFIPELLEKYYQNWQIC